jgi:hypothetical protein
MYPQHAKGHLLHFTSQPSILVENSAVLHTFTTGHVPARSGIPTRSRYVALAHDRCGQVTIEADIKSHSARAGMSEPSYEELKARLSQLEKEVETKKRSGDLIFKVGEKGGVSVYGLGRFPVTLYYEQWNRLLGAAEDLKKFMEENKSRLKLKEQG